VDGEAALRLGLPKKGGPHAGATRRAATSKATAYKTDNRPATMPCRSQPLTPVENALAMYETGYMLGWA